MCLHARILSHDLWELRTPSTTHKGIASRIPPEGCGRRLVVGGVTQRSDAQYDDDFTATTTTITIDHRTAHTHYDTQGTSQQTHDLTMMTT